MIVLQPTCCPDVRAVVDRESLRDVVLATQAHASKAYHLGFGRHVSKSTLAEANSKRDYRIFEEFAYRGFYETYSSASFTGLVKQLSLEAHAKPKLIPDSSATQEIMPFEMAQLRNTFVPIK